MEEEDSQIVVGDQEVENDEVFANDVHSLSPSPPPMAMLTSRRRNYPQLVESPDDISGDEAEQFTTTPSFAKLVRTVQFIKKWAKRAEREPDSARNEFLDRFKMNGPSIDSGFSNSVGEEEERENRRECRLIRAIKKRRHLILIWNPLGQWLYRLAVVVC